MKWFSCFILGCVILGGGCCIKPSRTEPTRPDGSKLGWRAEPNGKLAGSFILKKGESTEYANVRITAIDIIDHNCMFSLEHSPIWVKLRFEMVSNKNVTCEMGPVEGSAFWFGPECEWLTKIGFRVIGVRGINTRENWAYFDINE